MTKTVVFRPKKLAGGEESGKKIHEEFGSCIRDSKSQQARKID